MKVNFYLLEYCRPKAASAGASPTPGRCTRSCTGKEGEEEEAEADEEGTESGSTKTNWPLGPLTPNLKRSAIFENVERMKQEKEEKGICFGCCSRLTFKYQGGHFLITELHIH